MKAAIPLFLALALPLAAGAEVRPETEQAMKICAASASTYPNRLAQLATLGWQPLPPEMYETAGLALAPYFVILIRAYGLTGDWDVPTMVEQLQRQAGHEVSDFARTSDSQTTLALPTGEFLRISTDYDDPLQARCLLAATGMTVADVQAATAATLNDISRLPLRLFSVERTDPDEMVDVTLLDFTPHAFAAIKTVPLVSITSSAFETE